jgi:hypothetical protein
MRLWDRKDQERSVIFLAVMALAGAVLAYDVAVGLDRLRPRLAAAWEVLKGAPPAVVAIPVPQACPPTPKPLPWLEQGFKRTAGGDHV